MNVRFAKQEVRLRLDRGEAERLAAGETLTERVRFPGGGRLLWRIDPGDAPPGLTWEDAELTIAVSAEAVAGILQLPSSSEPALRAELALDDGGTIALVIEVDRWSGTKKRERRG